MITDQITLNFIREKINPRFFNTSKLYVKENVSGYNSIMICANVTAYNDTKKDVLFAKIKSSGKNPYIAFDQKYKRDFETVGYDCYSIKSDLTFFRIKIDNFINNSFLINEMLLKELLNKIYGESLSFSSFGCCSRYEECSEKMNCVHPDLLYAAAACQWKKKLDKGNNPLKII